MAAMQPNPTTETYVQETQFATNSDDAEHGLGNAEEADTLQNNELSEDAPVQSSLVNGASYGAANGATRIGDTTIDARKAATSSRAMSPDLLRGLLMVLQAVDHCSVMQGAWRHGIALESESDGTVVNTWNSPMGWTARMLTHLCAPGFMFLLGMGIVYFGRSRKKLGWSSGRMVLHFAIRAFVLAAVNEVFTIVITGGKVAIINIVLLALAVNYLLAGLIWLLINSSELLISELLEPLMSGTSEDDATRPLLEDNIEPRPQSSPSIRASNISWHLHNAILLALAIVTIAWNHWLSPHHGRCPNVADPNYSGPTLPSGTGLGSFFDFWFLFLQTKLVISPFPPLAWLSPAILGLLYGRVVLARTWKSHMINICNASAGVLLMVLFVLTRILNFGNLSKNCLHMPEQLQSPEKNQYLTSFRSFFYIIKYPPSFAYIAFTMSLNFFLLGLFGTLSEKTARRIPMLITFGQSALFFYVLHLFLYSILGALAKMWFGHDLGYYDSFNHRPAFGTEGKPAVMWITWVIGLAILYPLCRWYSRYKSTKGPNSVWRFF